MLPQACDVLVLGAGLAGLRAALSCLQSVPGLSVAVVSLSPGPSGSSFANGNDALGIHVCLTDAEREAYVREVLALNKGLRNLRLRPELLAIQAEEGEARLRDLEALGLPFIRDDAGRLLPHSSCFSPDTRRAYVFKGLARAYRCFRRGLDSQGCRFLPGWMPVSVVRAATAGPRSGAPVAGVVLAPAAGGEPKFVAAKAVVAALGGPGRLFAHSMAGPNPGYGQGLLVRAGADMANLGFLQYMWGALPGKTFWQAAELGSRGWRMALPDGSESRLGDLVPELQELSARRAGHCPFGYGLPESALDLALASGLDGDGAVRLVRPDGGGLRVAPMAHASNGGAVIDADAQTSVPGLLACGECATGMHGANRTGGAMVLATQVFGHRAGVLAARIASNSGRTKIELPDVFATETGDAPSGSAQVRGAAPGQAKAGYPGALADEAERKEGLEWLARGLSRYAVLGGRPGHGEFADQARRCLKNSRDWRLSLSLETGLGILDGLPCDGQPPED